MAVCDETKPYIFISYAHRDGEKVIEIMNRLRAEGFNVWYDGGIDPGTEWDENIAKHIRGCEYFIAFVSNGYLESKNCKDELKFSRDIDKAQLLVYIEDVELPDGMAMRMNRIQAIFWTKYQNVEEAYNKLFSAKGIEKTRVHIVEGMSDMSVNPKRFIEPINQYSNTNKRDSNTKAAPWPIIIGAIAAIAVVLIIVLIMINTKNNEPEKKTDDNVITKEENVVQSENNEDIKPTEITEANSNENDKVNLDESAEADSNENDKVNLDESAEADSNENAEVSQVEKEEIEGTPEEIKKMGEKYYLNTEGDGIDYAKARYYFEIAFEKGDGHSGAYLGFMYEHAKGVPIDYNKAFNYYKRALELGHLYCYLSIGNMYKNGHMADNLTKEYAISCYQTIIELYGKGEWVDIAKEGLEVINKE